jgi:hypothetical protein
LEKGRASCEARVTTQKPNDMTNSTQMYDQLFTCLRQWSQARDVRHLKTLAWMVCGLIGSGKLSLSAWEPYVTSRATQAQSFERRWQRFLLNSKISITLLYLPLVLAALNQWSPQRLYLALDTTLLWGKTRRRAALAVSTKQRGKT